MVVPERWHDRHGNYKTYFEHMRPSVMRELSVAGQQVQFVYEAPDDGYTYGCDIDEVARVLCAVSEPEHWLPEIVAFRQPTRKQTLLAPVWGRCLYAGKIGSRIGPAIMIEAQRVGARFSWPRRMTLSDRDEFQRLVDEGHVFQKGKRSFDTQLTFESIRNTILYRTVLHELGHLQQYDELVFDDDAALDPDVGRAQDLYFALPSDEKEAYANAFAARMARKLRSEGVIPFASS